MNAKQAVSDIVCANTLPPQIDYRLPFKIKERKAKDYLRTLKRSSYYLEKANRQIEKYWESDASYYDSLF